MFLQFQDDLDPRTFSRHCRKNELSDRLSLTVESYGEFLARSAYDTRRSGFRQFLLLYTLRGQGELVYQRKRFRLLPQSVMLIDCNLLQHYRTVGELWHFRYVHFTGNAADYFYQTLTQPDRYAFPVRDPAPFVLALNSLFSCGDAALPYQTACACNALSSALLHLLAERQTEPDLASRAHRLDPVLHFLETHYRDPLSLDDLARSALLSKFYFVRAFKEYTGLTPHAYLTAFRISRAQVLLQDPDLSVENVADLVGYENASSFIRAFRAATGYSPGQYRKF